MRSLTSFVISTATKSVEEVLAVVISRKKRLNRLVEAQSKAPVADDEHHEIEYLIRQYLSELVKEQAQARAIRDKNGIGKKLRAADSAR
jgi:hypothetical protein